MPQYFQGRPSAAGAGYDPLSSGGSNLGRRASWMRPPTRQSWLPAQVRPRPDSGRSADPGVFAQCGGGAIRGPRGGGRITSVLHTRRRGAVLSVIGPRDARGNVSRPTRVVSVNEPCPDVKQPFLDRYEA
ncbi:putative potassium-transporting ATPase subunit C [Mycobacterium kansasii]|uniref:Putative potassium-transporting ATPase subunit C n=1 Tax=Mycobacterium kansasii TaxID=1768 RepID=A0A1V3XI51_MYCKA|nr:putative potassium-transporting ATPase subunit C [Mycobacterium kansasii]